MIKEITVKGKMYKFYKQHQWLILTDKNDLEIERSELFGKDIDECIKELTEGIV